MKKTDILEIYEQFSNISYFCIYFVSLGILNMSNTYTSYTSSVLIIG